MRKMRGWIALALAILLVATNIIYQLGTYVSASESEQQVVGVEESLDGEDEPMSELDMDEENGQVVVTEMPDGQTAEENDEAATAQVADDEIKDQTQEDDAELEEVVVAAQQEEEDDSLVEITEDINIEETQTEQIEEAEVEACAIEAKETVRVYVYVKLDTSAGVDTTGWNLNSDGWYTIGYMDLAKDAIPNPATGACGTYYEDYLQTAYDALGGVHYFSGNQDVAQGIDLMKVQWNTSKNGTRFGLKIDNGAASYQNEAPVGTNQWHLDGLLTIEKIEKHMVTVNYEYEDGTKAAESKVFAEVETGKSVTAISPVIEGYTPSQAEVKVTVLKDDVTVTIVYAKNYPKEALTIQADSAEKIYDGTPLSGEGYTYTEGILLDGDKLTEVNVEGSQTEVGSSGNRITSYKVMNGDKDVTSKYNIVLKKGTLTVKAQSINPEDSAYGGMIVNHPTEVEYDGQEHKWSPVVKDTDGNKLKKDQDYEVDYDTTDFVDVKVIKVTIRGIGNYDGVVIRTYEITKAPLTILTKDGEKTYDGTPLTAEGKVEGLVNGEKVSFEVTGSQTEVGSSQNTYELKWNKTAKEENYKLEETLGMLTVTEAPVEEEPEEDEPEDTEKPEDTQEPEDTTTPEDTEDVEDSKDVEDSEGVEDAEEAGDTEDAEDTEGAEDIEDTEGIEDAEDSEEAEDTEDVDDTEMVEDVEDTEAAAPIINMIPQGLLEEVVAIAQNIQVEMPDEEVPEAATNLADADIEAQETVISEDGAVPLANQKLGEHKCCIMHFLLSALSVILCGVFTNILKKRQKKNYELREELDIELAKRGLQTSKEQ